MRGTMQNNVSRCFSLFLSVLTISQPVPILLLPSTPQCLNPWVSTATAIQSLLCGEINTPLICLYYCPTSLFSVFHTFAARNCEQVLQNVSPCSVSLVVINGNLVLNQCH